MHGRSSMSRVVTVRYLRRRFWIAKLVLIGALAASAGVATLTLKTQEERSEYALALQHLGNAVNRVEEELDRLVFYSRRGAASRDAVRAAYDTLAEKFHGIVMASRDGTGVRAKGTGPGHVHPEGRAARSLNGHATIPQHDHLAVGPMPESLARIWVPGSGAPEAGPSANLEYVLDRMLLLVADVVHGEGPLSAREADRVQTIKSTIAVLVSPRFVEITTVLDEDVHDSVDRALASLLALLAIAAVVAVMNVFLIFRPLERAVMSAQAQLTVERDRALDAAAAKRNFLSAMSHELRTPMNGVLGFAGLLLNSDLKPEQRRQVEIIQSSGRTLLALVNDILDLSRMEAGALDLADEPFLLEEVIGEVLALAGAGAESKGIETAVYIDPALPARLRGDPERVRQILTNLVGNAVKFTERGTVTVEARRLDAADGSGATVELAVSDTGPGIPPDQHERIFERFAQAEGTDRRGAEGTGLGLAICRELAERMGGGVTVESAPGQGATFRVRLRLEPVEAREDRRERAQALAALSDKRILVVDHDRTSAGLIRRQLADWGLVVDVATGEQAAGALVDEGETAHRSYAVAILGKGLAGDKLAALAGRLHRAGARLLLVTGPGVAAEGDPGVCDLDGIARKPLMPSTLLETLARLAEDVPRSETPSRQRDGTGPRVLVAEDQIEGRELVVDLLSRAGFRVEAVEDGAEAVAAAAGLPYDIVLMDIRMPGMDGLEAARRIRALDGAAGRVPIIALTANASAADLAEHRAAGMDTTVAKPIDAERLIAVIHRTLRPALEAGVAAEREASGPAGDPAAGDLRVQAEAIR